MNDDNSLYEFQQEPRKQFADALYKRINPQQVNTKRKPFTTRYLFPAMTALVLALVITFGLMPRARAAAINLFREIAGHLFYESERPDAYIDQLELESDFSFSIFGESPDEGMTIFSPEGNIQVQQLGLDEIEDKYATRILRPAWLPEGFSLTDQPVFYELPGFGPSAGSWMGYETWSNVDGTDFLYFSISPATVKEIDIVAPTDIWEVKVNGRSAAMLKGSWSGPDEQDAHWNDAIGLTLTWEVDGITYRLNGAHIDSDSLIRIAESLE